MKQGSFRRACLVLCGAAWFSAAATAAGSGAPRALELANAVPPEAALRGPAGSWRTTPARHLANTSDKGNPPGVLFSENFEAVCDAAGGASPPPPWLPPMGFTTHNEDGRTPAGQVSWLDNHAWVVREDFGADVSNCVMFSTSFYAPVGPADDWAVFPETAAPALPVTANTRLSFRARAYDSSFPDGYEVRVSTAGTAVADFLAHPPLLVVAAESSGWNARTLDLSAYAGQAVRLAFRNTSNDMFLLVVDDVKVEDIPTFDPALEAIEGGGLEYAQVPAFAGYPYTLSAKVANRGLDPLLAVQVQGNVQVDGVPVQPLFSPPQALAPGGLQTVPLGAGVFDAVGAWAVQAAASSAQGDGRPGNSSLERALLTVTPDRITRAEGEATGMIGIGARAGGEVGQDFEFPTAVVLTGIGFTMTNTDVLPEDAVDPAASGDGVGDFNGVGFELRLRAWNAADDEPGALLETFPVTIAAGTAIGPLTLEIAVPDVYLPAGRYLLSVEEPTNPAITATVHTLPLRYTPATSWVIWPTSPYGGWANLEQFGAQFERALAIAARLRQPLLVPAAVDDAFDVLQDTSLVASVAGNDTPADDSANQWTVLDDVDHGTLVLAADGGFTYTSAAGYVGADAFVYQVCNATAVCDSAAVAIGVAPDRPLVANDAFATPEDTPLSNSVAGNDTLSGNGGNVYSVAADPDYGTLVLAADGSFTYTPAPDFHGADAFDYRLCDVDADCATAAVALTVDPADDPVAALDDGFDHGPMLFTGNVAGNDAAPDGGATWTLLTPPAAGTLDFRADGGFDYTPAVGNLAPMTFTYRLCDVDDDCDEASVALVPLPPAIFADGFEN